MFENRVNVMAKGPPVYPGEVRDRPSQQTCPRCERYIHLARESEMGTLVGKCNCPSREVQWQFSVLTFRWTGKLTEAGVKADIIREHEASMKSWEFAGTGWGR